jgi:nascent polypeptide-associated complex subunit alpha
MAELDTSALEAQIDANKHLNKNEKKARKALVKLGLKPVPNVKALTMKRPPSIIFTVVNPEVYKAPAAGGQETYVVYGQCQIDDGTQRRMPYPASFPSAGSRGGNSEEADEDMPALSSGGGEGSTASAEGLQEKDIDMVMSQANVSRDKAIEALKKNGGDIVNSIMDLTM